MKDTDMNKAEKARRHDLSDHAAMLDAQGLCVPCKLCGGAAEISDAGTGAGYYIRCENAKTYFRRSTGCLISEQRLGGWAYNVMEWWNKLHAVAPSPVEAIAKLCEETAMQSASGRSTEKRYSIYTAGQADMVASNTHPGMGYAALIRERFADKNPTPETTS